jgi:hypothetical protein
VEETAKEMFKTPVVLKPVGGAFKNADDGESAVFLIEAKVEEGQPGGAEAEQEKFKLGGRTNSIESLNR